MIIGIFYGYRENNAKYIFITSDDQIAILWAKFG